MRLRGFGHVEDEVALHLIELEVVGVFEPHNPAVSGVGRGGVSEKSDSVGGFEPPLFFKIVRGGVLRVFFDADTPLV